MVQVKQAPQNRKVVALVYGRPGTGKTTMAVKEAPAPLVLDCFERSWEVVEAPYVEVTPSNLEEVLRWLTNSQEARKYQTIIVDSLTMLQALLTDRPMTQQDWGQVSNLLNGLILHLTYKLPHNPHVIFLAHEKVEEEGAVSTYYVPALMPSVTRTLTATTSIIGRTELSLEKRVEGGRVKEVRVYWLGLQGYSYMAKVRNPKGEWPARIANPSFKSLAELLGLTI